MAVNHARSGRIEQNALMRCSYSATYAEPVDRVWPIGEALDQALSALPGATLARAGDTASGSVRCTLGSTQVTYRVTARATGRATAVDGGTRSTVITVEGKEARGDGLLAATLTVTAAQAGTGCTVEVGGDIAVTGRGERADATGWSRVLGRLADGFAGSGAEHSVAAPAPATGTAEPATRAARPAITSPDEPAAPRPALTAAVPGADRWTSRPSWLTPRLLGLAATVMVLVVRRRRRRARRARAEMETNGKH
ncbi:MAG TPA: hypothetical protein VME70_16110 [Mycobacteriales bacterium]|nr:hypothetical protein [Mycobacteriales bacterium]